MKWYVFIYYSCIVQFDEDFFLRKIKYVIFLAHFILVFIYMYLTNNLELMTTVIFKICLFFLLFKAIFLHVTSINKKYYTFVILWVEFLCSLIFFYLFQSFCTLHLFHLHNVLWTYDGCSEIIETTQTTHIFSFLGYVLLLVFVFHSGYIYTWIDWKTCHV